MRLAALLVLALASAVPAGAKAAHYVVQVKDMAFGPAPAHLKVGDTIEWQNHDIFRHSATAGTGAFDLDLPPDGHGQVTLRKAGTFKVYCRFHPTMTLRLTVAKP